MYVKSYVITLMSITHELPKKLIECDTPPSYIFLLDFEVFVVYASCKVLHNALDNVSKADG